MLLIASRQYLDDCVYPNVIGLSMPLKGYELVEKTREIVTEISEKQRRRKQRPKQRTREEVRLLDEVKELLMQNNQITESEARIHTTKKHEQWSGSYRNGKDDQRIINISKLGGIYV